MISQKNTRFVKWSAYALLVLGIIYVGLIGWGILTQDPETGFIRDHVRILMEITTMGSAMVLLLFTLSIKNMMEPTHGFLAEVSVMFMTILVTLTSFVHFISITVSNPIVIDNPLLSPLLSLTWPSLFMAVDILAWDVFFGIAFILLGISLKPTKVFSVASYLMISSGFLSLFGLISLPLNNINLRYIGIFGYTVMPILSCSFLLSKLRKLEKNGELPSH